MTHYKRREIIAGATAMAFLPSIGAGWSGMGVVKGQVMLKPGRRKARGLQQAVVFLKGVSGPIPNTSNTRKEIKQRNLEFRPQVSAVALGTTLTFPNEDKEFHNVYSHSNPEFDLKAYRSGVTKTVKTKRPGLIEVRCNMHHDMEAWVWVFDHRFFAVTDKHGTFRIPRVPPGRYPIVVWHPDGKQWQDVIEVRASETREVSATLRKRPRKRHPRKNGAPHKDY